LKSKQVQEFKETEIGKIPVDWKITQLDNICIKITDGSHLSPQQVDSGTKRIASVKDMKNNDFDFYSCKIISDSDFEQLEKNGCKPLENDVLFSKDGTMGISFVYKNIKNLVLLSSIAIIRTNSEISPYFLNFYLRNKIIQNYLISGYSSGSALPRIVLKDLKKLLVIVPKMFEQEKIVKILYDLDTKIESLQNQNHALEQMAQAIFKSWFVDFDGVTEWDDSELGKIPKGWSVKFLSEIVDISSGKRPNEKSKSATLEYNIPCYGASKIDYYVKEALIEKPILLTGRVGTLGIIHRVYSPCFPSDNTLILLPKDYLFFEFIYFNLKQIDFQSYNRGTSQPLITQTDLKKIKIIIPNQHLLKSFNTNVKEFFKKINQNDSQIDMVTKTRDALLPKLMSGEIRV